VIDKANDRIVRISYDQVKRWISNYSPERDFIDVYRILTAMSEEIFSMGMNAYFDGAIYKKEREVIIVSAKEYGYKIVELNIDIDYSVARERFQERIDIKKSNPNALISNVSPEKHRRIYDLYNNEKNLKAISLDSLKFSPDELYEQVRSNF